MAVLRFNKSLKIDLNLIALVLTSIFLIITMSLAAAVASRCPSKVSLRNALSSTCVRETNADAKDKCMNRWCNAASHWNNQCPGKYNELRERGFDPEYNRKYLDQKFPSDLSTVSLGFAAFAMLCFCILVQGLAHIADFVQPGSSGLRLTDKQKMFLQIWLGVSWLVLILTWVLVLAGSVQAQKEWGLYNSPCGVFISSAVFAALSLLMFAVYNTLALRKGPHLDAGSEPLTPVSGAGQKMKNDPGWRMGGSHDSNHVYSEEQLLESQGAPYYASPTAAGQTPTSATGGTVHVHVAPSYYNAPTYQAPAGGYVSAPGGHPAFNVESGDISAMGPLKQYGTEPITMTGPMERLRPGGASKDSLSTEIFASARPPPPPHLGFSSPPQAPPIIKAGQLANMSLEELQDATNNFDEENLLGQGGFGCVYRGQLSDGSLIAVKRLHPSVATGSKGSQGAREFQAEVEIISRVHHKNLVKLLGYCVTPEEQLLAYEFLPQGSLYEHLHRNTTELDWETRQRIAVGSARGLAYLHEDCAPKVIHRDIKASNILLDANFNAQVADFGLARLIKEENTHITTRVMGTFGYLAPDYAFSGQLNEKSDVYSFGVVLLELLTGKKPVDPSAPPGQQSLVQWAWQLEQDSETDESTIVDPLLDGKYNADEVSRMWSTAMKCVIHMPQKRPSMTKVLQLLLGDNKGDEEESVKPPKNNSAEKYRSFEEPKLTAIHEDHSGGQQSVSTMFAGILSDAKDDYDSSREAEVKEVDRPVNASKAMEGSPDKEDRNKARGMPENEDVPEQTKGMAKSSSNQWVPFASSALGSSPMRVPSNKEEKQFYGSSPQRVASGKEENFYGSSPQRVPSGREEKFYGSSPQRVASGREEKFYGSSPQRVASGREEKFYGSSPQRVASGREEKLYGSSPQRVASGREGSGEEDYDSATGEGLEDRASLASPRTPRSPRNEDRDNDTEVSAPHSVILPERFLEAR